MSSPHLGPAPWGTARLGHPRIGLRIVDSTNARARELAARGAPHGTLVIAREQSAGRGRQGRTWSAPAGDSLLMSLVLREVPRLLPLAAGVAVAETCDAVSRSGGEGGDALIKWPNDVLLRGRKVAGILVEGRPQEAWAVLGIGVNVAVRVAELPLGLRDRAGTLGLTPPDVERVLKRLLGSLGRWLSESDAAVLAAVRERDALLGRPVCWTGGEGTGAGVDADGRLVVVAPGGARRALEAGEVHLAGPSSVRLD